MTVPRARILDPRLALVLMAVFLALFPTVMRAIGGDVTLASRILILGLFGLGVDLIFGFTGLLSFGQAAFYGTGGFVAGYLMIKNIVPNTLAALAVGTFAATVAGFLVGALSLRQVGVYFAMLTIAFGELFFFLENSPLRGFTGGESGLPGVPRATVPLGFTTLDFTSAFGTYTFIAVLYFLSYALMRRIIASPYGMVLRAILENPARAAAVGHDVLRYKLTAFTIAAAYAGLAGGLLGVFQGYMPPEAFSIDQSGQIIVMTVIGGAGTLVGPLLGAFIWIFLQQALQNIGSIAGIWKLLLGLVFVLLVTGFRRGVAGGVLDVLTRRRSVAAAPPALSAEDV
ncbi:MAG: branched-chain amino acid ABC transporter permease [Candidatus Velthaea sp.]